MIFKGACIIFTGTCKIFQYFQKVVEYTPQILHFFGGVVKHIPQLFENIEVVMEYTPQVLNFLELIFQKATNTQKSGRIKITNPEKVRKMKYSKEFKEES